MINYLYANNYKSFVNFKIQFDNLNLIIGKNGSGKSNVFHLIASLRDLIMGVNHQTLVIEFGNGTKTRWMESDIQTFEISVSDKEYTFVYKLEVEHNLSTNRCQIVNECVICNDQTIYCNDGAKAVLYNDENVGTTVLVDPTISGVSYIPADNEHKKLLAFKKQISDIILCMPDPKLMQDVVLNDVYYPRIDFANISSAYAGLVQLDTDIYNDITKMYREIYPNFIKARISPEQYAKYLTFDYQFNEVVKPFHFNELSDGEKMIFALYMLLYGYIKMGKTVLLDEPDNYISIREIQPWCIELERIIENNGQCIMISHHPEIIDYMAETKGIWLSRNKSGETRTIDGLQFSNNKELLKYSEMIARGILDEA